MRTSLPGRASVTTPKRRTHCPATQLHTYRAAICWKRLRPVGKSRTDCGLRKARGNNPAVNA